MSERSLLRAATLVALFIAAVTGYMANRSIKELRDVQTDLAREVRALQAAQKTAAASFLESEVRRDAETVASVGVPMPSGHAEIEALSRRMAQFETNDRIQAAREEAIGHVARLEGKARAKALEDLEALVSLGDEEARQVVLEGLFDRDPRVRESALSVIAKSGDPVLLEALEPLVRDPSQDVRKELADALEDASAELAGPMLMALLDDPDWEVVEDAVKSLGALGYREARGRIVELVDPENPKLTGAVGEALRDFDDVSGMEESIAALAIALEHENPEIRRSAVKEIGQIGGASARAYLEAALDDEDFAVRSEARKRIAKL